jgi:hypothetical protein
MKKLIISSVAILLFTVSSFAQRGANHLEKLSTALELSADQKTVLANKFETFHANLKQLRTEEGEWETKKASMKTLKQNFRKEIVSVLNAEQLEKFESHEANRKGKRKAFHKGGDENMKGKKGKFAMHKKQRGAKRAAFKKELLPIALEQRAKLDKEISKKDRKTIDKLRVAIKTKKEAQRKVWKERKEVFKNGEKPSKEEIITMKEQYRLEREEFMAGEEMTLLKALVEKYDSEIEEYTKPIHAAKDKLIEEHKSKSKSKANCEGDCKGKGAKGHAGKSMMKGKRGHRKGMAGKESLVDRRKAKFLLLDPEMKVSEAKFERPSSTVDRIKVFPNPATNLNTISYNVKTAGKIDVQLWDEKGNLIKTVFSGMQEAGDQQIQVTTGELISGGYYYTIKDANGVVINKKFIKAK